MIPAGVRGLGLRHDELPALARSHVPGPPDRLQARAAVDPRARAEYGGDPSFVVVTGGSAGGHLAPWSR